MDRMAHDQQMYLFGASIKINCMRLILAVFILWTIECTLIQQPVFLSDSRLAVLIEEGNFITGIKDHEIDQLAVACHSNSFTKLLDTHLVGLLESREFNNLIHLWHKHDRDFPLLTHAISQLNDWKTVPALVKQKMKHTSEMNKRLSTMDVELLFAFIRQQPFTNKSNYSFVETYLVGRDLRTYNTHQLYSSLIFYRYSHFAESVRRTAQKHWAEDIPKIDVDSADREMHRLTIVKAAIKSQDIDLLREALLQMERIAIPSFFPDLSAQCSNLHELMPFLASRLPCRKYTSDIYHMSLLMSPDHRGLLAKSITNRKLLERLLRVSRTYMDNFFITSLLNNPNLRFSPFTLQLSYLRSEKMAAFFLAAQIRTLSVESHLEINWFVKYWLGQWMSRSYTIYGWSTDEFRRLVCVALTDSMPAIEYLCPFSLYDFTGKEINDLFSSFGPELVYLLSRYINPRRVQEIAKGCTEILHDLIFEYLPESEAEYRLAKTFDFAVAKINRHFVRMLDLLDSSRLFYTDPQTGMLMIQAIDRAAQYGRVAASELVKRQVGGWKDLTKLILVYLSVINHPDIFIHILHYFYLVQHHVVNDLYRLQKVD